MVVMDLDCEEDWGEVEVMTTGALRIRLGNDSDGYWLVKGAYELIDSATDRHEGRWEVCHELPLHELARRVLVRMDAF